MMMNELRPRAGATRKRKRVGCGTGSGHGKTSTRGHKGSGQHSAPRKDERYEGGQMPFYRKLPKRGFKNYTRVAYEVVNISDLSAVAAERKVTPEMLRAAGLLRRDRPVKVLGNGVLEAGLQVAAHAFSASAKEKIEKAGGKVEVLKW
jgi:large subunit ribosomal protein L15